MDSIKYTISLDSLTLLRYLILSFAIFFQFFNFKVKVYQAALVFTLLAVFVLGLNSTFNLSQSSSDYSYHTIMTRTLDYKIPASSNLTYNK